MRACPLRPGGGTERLLQREIADVQSGADDRALDTLGHELGQPGCQPAMIPAGHTVSVGTFAYALQQAEVGPDSMPSEATSVTTYRHSRPRSAAPAWRTARRRRGSSPAQPGCVPHVQPDRDPVTEGADDLLAPFGPLQRCRTDATRAQPVASARSRLASSRMPPESSTWRFACAVTSATSSALPRPNAASRSTRCSHSAPARCQRSTAASGIAEPLLAARHALDQLHGLLAGDINGRAAPAVRRYREIHPMTLSELTLVETRSLRLGSLATISSYEASMRSAISSSGMLPSRRRVPPMLADVGALGH